MDIQVGPIKGKVVMGDGMLSLHFEGHGAPVVIDYRQERLWAHVCPLGQAESDVLCLSPQQDK